MEPQEKWTQASVLSMNRASQVISAYRNAHRDEIYAFKRASLSTNELKFIKYISDTSVIHTHCIFLTPNWVYFQQDLFESHLDIGNFKFKPVKPTSSDDLTSINSNIDSKLTQMIAAISYVHSIGIIHRDIKPSNFLIKGDKLVLSDFDSAYLLSNDKSVDETNLFNSKLIGTPLFLAPELLNSKFKSKSKFLHLLNNKKKYKLPLFKLDIFSFGVTLYYLIYNSYPFNGENEYTVQNEIMNLTPVYPDTKISHPIIKLIPDLLVKSVDSRISLDQLINSLGISKPHPQSIDSLPKIIKLDKDLDIDCSNNKLAEDDEFEQFNFKLPIIFHESNSSVNSNKSQLKHSKLINFKTVLNPAPTMAEYLNNL